ncbi:lysine--tRNA ligase [Candidatus Uhrbacteria bacterium]|nr:lysine--tRNA ligase [Candidatus Uhrbacteria bacterium]
MMQEEQDRLGRLQKLRESGVDPYPTKGNRTMQVQDFLDQFETLQSTATSVSLVGRLRLLRPHGGLTFGQIQDESGLVQIAFKKDHLADAYDQLQDTIDLGDFLEVSGTAFTTKKGERSIDVAAFRMLTKTLLPLPEKWHGISDVETRFRKRYLDLIMNEDVRKTMRTRSNIISAIRSLLDSRGFLEVETPTLQPVYGGGFARPFVTHHNALDADFYLRISDEMYLKRLLVGGFEKVYEITKVFRNEGIDRDHNPEFTMFEAQIAYENYEYGMDLFEEIFEHAVNQATGSTTVQHEGECIELKRPWKRMSLVEALKEVAGIDKADSKSVASWKQTLLEELPAKKIHDLEMMKSSGALMAFAFEELVEEKLIQPTIIYDYPVEVSPLAKKTSDPRFVERFEAFALGSEIGNNYSELNDPVDLEKRFLEEKNKEQAGFDEAHQTDVDYLEAIKHGMPPACGLGIGVDRMVMLLTGSANIKEVILFPTLRPERE